MQLNQVLLLLTAASAVIAAPNPFPGFGNDKCEPYSESVEEKNTFSFELYEEANCGSKKKHVDGGETGKTLAILNECQKAPKGIKSYIGIAHTNHKVTFYSKPGCNAEDLVETMQYGAWRKNKNLGKKTIGSYLVTNENDHFTYPRYGTCGQLKAKKYTLLHEKGTRDICGVLARKCEEWREPGSGKCSTAKGLTELNMDKIPTCYITGPDEQYLFDEYCEDTTGFSCVELVLDANGKSTSTYKPCRKAEKKTDADHQADFFEPGSAYY